MNFLSPPTEQIVPQQFFYRDGFGIKLHTKVDMPRKRYTKFYKVYSKRFYDRILKKIFHFANDTKI